LQLSIVNTISKAFKYHGMCNDRSNNLDHSDQLVFFRGKHEE